MSGSAGQTTTRDNSSFQSLSTTIIRVLVAYTPVALAGAGDENSMNALINNSIAAANQSFVNSGVPVQFELALRAEVTYTEVGTSSMVIPTNCPTDDFDRPDDLIRFQGPSDGFMDEIHDLRALSAADVAVLLHDPLFPYTSRGTAYAIYATAGEAFCVMDYMFADAAQSWTLTHEIGHLIAARHELDFDNTDCPVRYGHGFVSGVKNFKTMMAISPRNLDCNIGPTPTCFFRGHRWERN